MTQKTRKTAGVATAVVATMGLALTACSGGGESSGVTDETNAALKVCEQVFGAKGVTDARAVLGNSGFRAESGPLDEIKESMLKEARAYVPGSEDLSRNRHDVCRLSAEGEGDTVGSVDGRVKWSVLTMDSVTSGPTAGDWRRAAANVYVQREKRRGGLATVLPCRIPGAAEGQERELPLEISVLGEGLGGDKEAVLGTLLASLAQDTQKRLGCVQPVSVPATLVP
ncbi:hypothetical protein ABZX98_24435 [Streptomyces sp. NPDC002992]|uniref:hypothetical protein n=1 Tax=Streptomyces sp. NPDC002992 TaxID=3154273 RepID=UPI0033A07D3E